jgi:hypothetical protein
MANPNRDDDEQRNIVFLPDVPGIKPAEFEEHPDEVMHCYICVRMRESRPQKHGSLVSDGKMHTCLLCSRDFCDKHSGHDKDVCETNHDTYYRNHRHLQAVYPSLTVRASILGLGDRAD